jgi:hypothetical protein
MGIARTLLGAGMAVVALTAVAEQVTLKATNGQVISRSLGKPAKHLVINGTISVAQFSDSEGWPTQVSVVSPMRPASSSRSPGAKPGAT